MKNNLQKTLSILLFLISSNSIADNPRNVFGVELDQDVFTLSSIEKLGNAYMAFKVTPESPTSPFDFYSIKANNNFQVHSIQARAKVSSENCDNELIKTAHQTEIDFGIKFKKINIKKKIAFVSEDEKTVFAMTCNRYRKYKEKNLKDIILALSKKEKISTSTTVDKEKASKMFKLLQQKKIQRREIKLVSNSDFSGVWSTKCSANKSGILIKKIRNNIYNFLICSSSKCINAPRITTENVKILSPKLISINNQDFEFCTTLNK